jgi:GDP-fucose transporter C1
MARSSSSETQFKKQFWYCALSVSFYMIFSIFLRFCTRLGALSRETPTSLLFFTWYQFTLGYAIIVIVALWRGRPVISLCPPLPSEFATFRKVLPVAPAFFLMLFFNTKSIECVSTRAYELVKSFSIVFTLILSFLILKERISLRACLACLVVVIGFVVAKKIELSVDPFVYGVLASCSTAVYAVAVKKVLGDLDGNEYLFFEYVTPISLILLTPVVWFQGGFRVFEAERSTVFWVLQTIMAIMGFVLQVAVVCNIKYTSALTHNLAGSATAFIQTPVMRLFGSPALSGPHVLGIVMVIIASIFYAYVRTVEMKENIIARRKARVQDKKQVRVSLSGSGSSVEKTLETTIT